MTYLTKADIEKFDSIMQTLDFKQFTTNFNFESLYKEFEYWLSQYDTFSLPHFHDPFGNDFQLEVAGLWDHVTDPMLAARYFHDLKKDPSFKMSSGPTDLIKFFPNTCQELYKLKGLVRAKLSRLPAGIEVPWHEHEATLTNRTIVLHIPIKSTNDVKYEVKIAGNVTQKTFNLNNLWLFAAYPNIFHRVINTGIEDRWNLWMNLCVIRHDGLLVNEDLYKQIISQ